MHSNAPGCGSAATKKPSEAFKALGIESPLVPYAVDTAVFFPLALDERNRLRAQWSIPLDKYLIGNFHRDSAGADLTRPKFMKGADVFLEVVSTLHRLGHPVHILLAGPRRHYLRRALQERGVPFTFVGTVSQARRLP